MRSRTKRAKLSLLANLCATPTLALISLALAAVPSKATNVEIKCSTQEQIPTVVAHNSQQEVAILQFLPQYFAPQNALTNCQHTAQTLQNKLQQNHLSYLTSEVVDQQSVVCTVERRGKGCTSPQAEVLFSLATKTAPNQVLYELLGKQFKSAEPFNPRTVSRIYTKIDRSWWDFWRF
ncbi:COP23 domain-containing protein [Stanieria cyanosphaera]|nr:COP23 domain-containing protein [Stanieria cyanosphaera]